MAFSSWQRTRSCGSLYAASEPRACALGQLNAQDAGEGALMSLQLDPYLPFLPSTPALTTTHELRALSFTDRWIRVHPSSSHDLRELNLSSTSLIQGQNGLVSIGVRTLLYFTASALCSTAYIVLHSSRWR